MITLHPTSKRFADGFIPMIIIRNEKGQCVGSRTPQGGYREFRTFTNSIDAGLEAVVICERVAARYPDILKTAERVTL